MVPIHSPDRSPGPASMPKHEAQPGQLTDYLRDSGPWDDNEMLAYWWLSAFSSNPSRPPIPACATRVRGEGPRCPPVNPPYSPKLLIERALSTLTQRGNEKR